MDDTVPRFSPRKKTVATKGKTKGQIEDIGVYRSIVSIGRHRAVRNQR